MKWGTIVIAAAFLGSCRAPEPKQPPKPLTLREAQELALKGDRGAALWLNEYYFDSEGAVPASDTVKWLKVAAQAGSESAALNLAAFEAQQGGAANCDLAEQQLRSLAQHSGPAQQQARYFLKHRGPDALCNGYWK